MIRKLYAGKSWFAVGLAVIAVTMIAALGGCVAQEQESAEEVQAQKADQLSEEPEAVPEPEMDATPKSDASSESSADADASVKASVEDYTWEELSQISNEIAQAADEDAAIEVAKRYNLCTPDGKLDGTQVKSVTLSDGTQATVQIVGFAHDDKTEGGKAGITFMFGVSLDSSPMNETNTNEGGWEKSQMRSKLNTEMLDRLPSDLVSVIVSVDKLTNNVGKTSEVSSVTKTSDKLWLFSPVELVGPIQTGDTASIDNIQGTQYRFFNDMGARMVSTSEFGTEVGALWKMLNVYTWESNYWWERSPSASSSEVFYAVGDPGPYAGYLGADASVEVVPGFCI